jgi:hypothetical protein
VRCRNQGRDREIKEGQIGVLWGQESLVSNDNVKTRMNLKNIMQNGRSQTQKTEYLMILFM